MRAAGIVSSAEISNCGNLPYPIHDPESIAARVQAALRASNLSDRLHCRFVHDKGGIYVGPQTRTPGASAGLPSNRVRLRGAGT